MKFLLCSLADQREITAKRTPIVEHFNPYSKPVLQFYDLASLERYRSHMLVANLSRYASDNFNGFDGTYGDVRGLRPC
jgi:hypothetical protein